MPRLSDSMQEGAISQWLVEDGAEVHRGQEILEVETDKALMTYEAEHTGALRIVVPAGVTVPVGTLIAVIGEQEPAPVPSSAPPGTSPAGRRTDASPFVRRVARERGVDLELIAGTGPGGRITQDDVLAAVSSADAGAGSRAPEPPEPQSPEPQSPEPQSPEPQSPEPRPTANVVDRRRELTRPQRVVASRMSAAKQTIPDFWASITADVTELVALRQELKAASSASPDGSAAPVPTVNDFLLRACASALVQHPQLNTAYDDGHVVTYAQINLGFAVDTPDRLLVPVIRAADRLSVHEIAAVSRRLVQQSLAGKVPLADLDGGTFTVSNLGAFGVRAFAPIINGPQAAILGVGAVHAVCAPDGPAGGVTVRQVLDLTLSCDHRIVYGADAARFLRTLADTLAAPRDLG